MKVASTDAAAAAAAAVPGTGNCAPNRTTVRYSSRRSSKKLSSVLTAVVSTIIISLLLLSDTAASALPKKKKSKTPPPPKKKTSKKTFKNAKHSRVPNPPPTPPSTQPPTPPPSPTPTRPPTTSPPTTMYTACSDVCPNSSDLCAKQCAALDSCTDDIASAITPYQETWDTVLMGGIDVWTAQMLKFIAAAPYGMYMYDQDEFCEKIAEWVVDDNGYNDDRDSDVDEESIVAQCVAVGFPDTLMGSESSRSTGSGSSWSSANTNACGAQLDKTTSPTQCFEPDASNFYNFKGSRGGTRIEDPGGGCPSQPGVNCCFIGDPWAYLSHNYEYIDQATGAYGVKYSWGTGQATGQTFAYNNACGDEVHQYQTWAGGNGNIGSAPSNDGQFLISGNILTDSNNPTVTNTMWRFQNYNPTTMGWEITNRRSGMKMSISTASEANCNMQGSCPGVSIDTTNVAVAELDTDGCNFCGWTTNANVSYPYSLYCHDGSVSTKFISKMVYNYGEFWYNFNVTITVNEASSADCQGWNQWGGEPLNNEFCIEEVGSFQRIDIYNTTSSLSTSGLKKGTYSTVANYAVKGMSFASIVFGGEGYAGVSDLFGLLSLITPLGDDKTSALENLASEAATEAKLMTVTYDAATFQVVPTTTALNCQRNSFGCDYGYLGFLNQFPFSADTKSKMDYVCDTLIQEVHNYFKLAFTKWSTGFLLEGLNETECDAIPYGRTNTCPTYNNEIDYWTWRLGWNSINMGINGVDKQPSAEQGRPVCPGTSYQVLLLGINQTSTASEVCTALYHSEMFPSGGSTPTKIPNVQSVFESVLKILPPTLASARTNQGTIQGSATCSNGGCDCHDPFGSSIGSNNYQCRYTGGGPNYFSYGWNDAYFKPTAKQQAYYYFQDGDAQCNWPQNDYYAVGEAYYEEIQWDMLNWSYGTTNQTSALDNYEKFFISTCEQVITNNATAQMEAHIQETQSNSTCSQLCANSNNTSVICKTECP